MRAIWTGSISFGLVNIPINLYSGFQDRRLNLHMLHKKDESPIRYVKKCRLEDKEVPYAEIVKGYEFQKNEYVVLEDKDFAAANVRATHLIEIVEFVNEKEIDIRLYERPYYLEPGRSADKAYGLLGEALFRSKKVGVAKFVLHDREHLAILKFINGILVLNTIRYVTEIRDIKQIKITKAQLSHQEMDTALALIKQLTHSFKLDNFHDTYIEELNAIIKEKASGKMPKVKGKKLVNTTTKNLMYVLKESLKKSRDKKSIQLKTKVKTRRRAT